MNKIISSENSKISMIGGYSIENLVSEFGTPLYVMDENKIRSQIKLLKKQFTHKVVETEIAYASKAFLCLAMCQIIKDENLSIDVVSGGELYIALKSGISPNNIIFHGNNKSIEELKMAIENNIGRIVVDNLDEFHKIESIAQESNKSINILIRVNPGIDAHTHEYIQTSKNDSKFGISIYGNKINKILSLIKKNESINFLGFHCHIGSQIFEEEFYFKALEVMMKFIETMILRHNVKVKELNLGGGFGIAYVEKDRPIRTESLLPKLLEKIFSICTKLEINIPKILIEPGRLIVGEAGTTLYRIGALKETYSGKEYIFVDGGMTDNPRPALYKAKYSAEIISDFKSTEFKNYSIAGKCCESGDVIISDITLPVCKIGDILAVRNTGAYNYSMSSNYNKITRPAVVFVTKGKPYLKVKRETYADLYKNDLI